MRKFIIYGKGGCPACVQAKQLIEQKGFEYQYKTIAKDYTLSEFAHLTEQRTFPHIREIPVDKDGNLVDISKENDLKYITKNVGTFADLQKLLEDK